MKVCLFSSYFKNSSLPPYIKYYLLALRPHFDQIIFITNNDKYISEESHYWLNDNTDHAYFVKNEGLDFGMWQKALLATNSDTKDKWSEICLCNDSCICFAPLGNTLNRMRSKPESAVGLVKSHQILEHIQSYFMILRNDAIPVGFRHIQETNFADLSYDEVVKQGELALSEKLINEGISLGSLYEPTKDTDCNPSFSCFYELLDLGICPTTSTQSPL